MRVRLATSILTIASALLLGATSRAQVVIDFEEDLDWDRPEAWGMKYFTSFTLLNGMSAPNDTVAGTIDFGVEVQNMPSLSKEERTIGFNGTKEEDLNRLPAFVRPRVIIGLPANWALTLAYVPPVEIEDVKANIFSFSLGRPFYDGDSWRFGGRFWGGIGNMKGSLTCTDEDVRKGTFNCLAKSDDQIDQRYAGIELTASFDATERLEPHFSFSTNYMDLEFQVNSRYGNFIDHSLLNADGFTYAATAGLSFQASERIMLAGELFYSPLDVVRREGASSENDPLFNFRLLATYRIRKK